MLVLIGTRRASRSRRSRVLAFTGASLVYLACIAPLLALRFAYPAPEVIVQAAGLANAVPRLPVIIVGFLLRAVQHWYLAILLLGIAVWQMHARTEWVRLLSRTVFWLPAAVVIAQLGADAAGIAVNTFEVHSELQWAAGRLLLQLTPMVYLAAFTVSSATCVESTVPSRHKMEAKELRSTVLAS